MNILNSKLPTKIKVNNNIYDINYDYHTIINILEAYEDKELTQFEKYYITIKNLYKEEVPEEDYVEALNQAFKFINCGVEDDKNDNKKETRIYSFTQDANYIFSGITSTHHIDLEKDSNMHWWKFNALFMDMSPECLFGELIYYRKRLSEGKLTKEEKNNYKKIKNIVDLKTDNVKEQLEARKQFLKEFYN